jgi:hypothetical protein
MAEKTIEIIAKALYRFNRYGGRPPRDPNDWPPAQKGVLSHYWNLATAVAAALNRSEGHGPSPLPAGTAAPEVTRDEHQGKLAPDLPQAAGAGCDICEIDLTRTPMLRGEFGVE